MRRLELILAMALACSWSVLLQKAQADLILTLEDVQVGAGGSGHVDVFIESVDGGNLDAFQYKFEIVDSASNTGDLRFTSTQQSTELAESNYVHAGDSGGFISVPQNSPAFDEILGGDFTDSFNGTDLTSTKLLVRLDIEHILPQGTPLEAADGDGFTITLAEDSDTFFLDRNFQALAISSSESSEVTIVAVPEPSGVFVLVLVVFCLLARRQNTLKRFAS